MHGRHLIYWDVLMIWEISTLFVTGTSHENSYRASLWACSYKLIVFELLSTCVLCCCNLRVELRQKSGSALKSFSLHECEGRSKEFRGVIRAGLLKSLTKSLPEGCLRNGIKVNSVDTSSGLYLGTLLLTCHIFYRSVSLLQDGNLEYICYKCIILPC